MSLRQLLSVFVFVASAAALLVYTYQVRGLHPDLFGGHMTRSWAGPLFIVPFLIVGATWSYFEHCREAEWETGTLLAHLGLHGFGWGWVAGIAALVASA